MGDLKGSPISHLTYEDRLKTYSNWPPSAPIPKESLARAGFIYKGSQIKVQCFTCLVTCDSWNFGDTAIRKHKELQPDCPFVRENTDVLTDSSFMIVDPQMQQPIVTMAMAHVMHPISQVDHGRGPGLCKQPIPEFYKVWPNYEVMNKESERRKTYINWPLSFLRSDDMARAGFVFLKKRDNVQCVFCYGVVGEWEREDNPFQDHLRHFPNCPFVKGINCNNISIEDELRGVGSKPLLQPHRDIDECGHENSSPSPMEIETFRPERAPIEKYAMPQENNALHLLNVIAHQPSIYPKYASKDSRKESYQNWPSDIPQDVAALIDAGFFYTGEKDSVKCYQCGGGLKNWEENDVPWEEHARWFPDCQYVVLNKGRHYVTKSQKNKPPIIIPNSNEVRTPTEEMPSTSINTNYPISQSELETLMNQDIVKKVLEMGLERHKVEKALEARMKKNGYPFTDSESLANAALEIQDDNSVALASNDEKVNTTNEGKEQLSNTSQLNEITQHHDDKSLCSGNQRPRARDEDIRLCKVCMDRDMNVVFLPCGHFVACIDCATVMENCPVCRQKIKGNVKTYWP